MTTDTSPDWLADLTAIPADMAARVIAWMPEMTLDGYQAFLNMMYHYTLGSEARLRHAAAHTRHDALRALYLELADEEAPHYLLASRDLATFQSTPTPTTPPEVAAFQHIWDAATATDELVWLGALYALESVGDHLGTAAHAAMTRLQLRPEQATFVLVHLEADEEHGALCAQLARTHGSLDPASLLSGARRAGDAWVEMHRCILSGDAS